MQASDIIALFALGFTLISIVYTISVDVRNRKIVKIQTELNERLLAKEIEDEKKKDKAEVNANFFKNFNDDWTLKIFNKGNSIARNVSWEIVGDDPEWFFNDNVFPLEILNPNQSIDIHVSVFLNSKPKTKIRIKWSDNSSENNIFETVISY